MPLVKKHQLKNSPRRHGACSQGSNAVRIASCCTGLGTESFAFQKLRRAHRLVMACEKEPHLRKFLHRAHAPEVLYKDALRPAFIQWNGISDVFLAGFPCQPYSGAGDGHGLADIRGGPVINAIVAWLRQHRPRAFVLENFAGLPERHADAFESIMTALRKLGSSAYNVVWKKLNCEDFGAPQHRPRVYIVGILKSAARDPFES